MGETKCWQTGDLNWRPSEVGAYVSPDVVLMWHTKKHKNVIPEVDANGCK